MDASVESFYDTSSSCLIEDHVHKNESVQHQSAFLGCPCPHRREVRPYSFRRSRRPAARANREPPLGS